jgi:hypothetical protein
MTDLPSQQEMSSEQKAIRKIELQQLNNLCDKRLGRDTSPLFTEKGLSKETIAALDSLEQKKPAESKLTYKVSADMEKKLAAADDIIAHRPAPKAVLPILSLEERTRAYHKALGTPQRIVDYELAELKKQQEAKQ